MRRGQLVSGEQAVQAKGQHKNPCADCPWSRQSLPGWLGGLSAQEWLQAAHGETLIDCHTLAGAQCAGSAIYRANVAKLCRSQNILRLPADRDIVFATPAQFIQHHTGEPK